MSDRLDVLGGSVVITSRPGGPTRVTGSLPIGATVEV
jgi:signal transduction histidine kinase